MGCTPFPKPDFGLKKNIKNTRLISFRHKFHTQTVGDCISCSLHHLGADTSKSNVFRHMKSKSEVLECMTFLFGTYYARSIEKYIHFVCHIFWRKFIVIVRA